VNFLKENLDFPAHHVSLGWWLAIAITLWNVIIRNLGVIAGQLSLLGKRFRKDQTEKRIRNIEYLHDNTNGLIRYLADDTVNIAIEASWTCISLVVLLVRLIPVRPDVLFEIIALNITTSVIGRAWRIRTMLNDLRNYPASVELLKTRLSKM
jgi:hypothetical protein